MASAPNCTEETGLERRLRYHPVALPQTIPHAVTALARRVT